MLGVIATVFVLLVSSLAFGGFAVLAGIVLIRWGYRDIRHPIWFNDQVMGFVEVSGGIACISFGVAGAIALFLQPILSL